MAKAPLSVETQPPPILRSRMPELDTLRGIAILAVVFYHALYLVKDYSLYPRLIQLGMQSMWLGRLGVNLFFVLSGFLITGILLESRGRTGYYRRFYIHRALRIFPAYFLLIAALFLLAYPAKFLVLSVLYLSNLAPLFGIGVAYPILWSLAVEEHFYLVWPWLANRLAARGLGILTLAIVVLSPAVRWFSFSWSVPEGVGKYTVYDFTWNSADGLACGALLAIALREFPSSRKRLWQWTALVAAAAAAIWLVGAPLGILTRQTQFGAAMQIVPWNFFFVAVLLAFLLIGTSESRALVQIPLLMFYGEISYGLYLYHLLVIRGYDWATSDGLWRGAISSPTLLLALRFLSVMLVATGAAWFSRRFYEDKFLKLKSKFS